MIVCDTFIIIRLIVLTDSKNNLSLGILCPGDTATSTIGIFSKDPLKIIGLDSSVNCDLVKYPAKTTRSVFPFDLLLYYQYYRKHLFLL